MAIFFVYKIRSHCTECGEALMLDGPTLQIECRACQSMVPIDEKNWKAILGFRNARQLKDGELKNGAIIGDQSFYIRYGQMRPVCAGCETPLDLYASPPGTDGDVGCGQCGQSMSTFPPPQWLLKVEPEALQIFGAVRESELMRGPAVETAQALHPVTFGCPECGGNLKITHESPRILDCTYCKNSLYLPDALWRALHPVRKRTAWYVAFN